MCKPGTQLVKKILGRTNSTSIGVRKSLANRANRVLLLSPSAKCVLRSEFRIRIGYSLVEIVSEICQL